MLIVLKSVSLILLENSGCVQVSTWIVLPLLYYIWKAQAVICVFRHIDINQIFSILHDTQAGVIFVYVISEVVGNKP